MQIRTSFLVSTLVLLSAAGACSRDADQRPAVAEPTVTLSRDKAAIGSPLRLTYRFEPTDQKIEGDYWVFFHVLDQDGERLWGDDHQPSTPTSTWQAGRPVEYTRTVFLPNYPYIGPAEMRVGLYMPSTGERLPLSGTEVSRREYTVGKLEILPQKENIFLIYKEGWHPAEVDRQDPTTEWQWTRKAATVSFRNPRKDSTFYLEYDARPDRFTTPQQVTIRLGDKVVGTFTADARGLKLVTFPISATQFGEPEVVDLMLDVDRTFEAGEGDTRELGIRVFHAFVEPK